MITRDDSNDTVEPADYLVPAAAPVYSTVVRQEGKKVTAKLPVEGSEGEEKTGDETDYFDDPDMLEQIRAQKK